MPVRLFLVISLLIMTLANFLLSVDGIEGGQRRAVTAPHPFSPSSTDSVSAEEQTTRPAQRVSGFRAADDLPMELRKLSDELKAVARPMESVFAISRAPESRAARGTVTLPLVMRRGSLQAILSNRLR